MDFGRYFCYLATVYLYGVGPMGDLGVHGPVQRDKLLRVEPVHDNNDKAVVDQGSGPNLNKNRLYSKKNIKIQLSTPTTTNVSPIKQKWNNQ